MPGKLTCLKQEFLIDGEWDGIALDALLRHLKAGIGAGCSSLADAFWITLGAVSLKLLPAVTEQAQAMRATVAFDSGIWVITHDLLTQEISFLNTATGQVEDLPVVAEGGERSAGSYSVELMGIPVVETARGSVTIDSVMTLLYLQQAYAGHTVYGGANLNDLGVTIEVCFGLLDEKATKLKAQSTAAKRSATKAATDLKKALEQRIADGLPTSVDLDTDEARLAKALDAANAEVLRLDTELEAHLAIHATRAGEQAQALRRAADAGTDADRAQQALAPLYEARGQARAALAQAEQDARPRTHCPECDQLLQQAAGPGPACVLCGQPDPARDGRQARKTQRHTAALDALASIEDSLKTAQARAQQAVDTRGIRIQAAQKAASRSDAYRTVEITPREQAKAKAAATAAETRAAITAVRERRKELVRLSELERMEKRTADAAEQARTAWTMAEGDAQHVRQQTAKELSMIYADKVIPMAPDKIRYASIDSKTFAPKLNGRTVRQLARSAGMINIANNGLHLAFLEASRTLPGMLLPCVQWLDSSLDGLGAGDEGALLAARTLQVISATAADDAQIIVATAHELPPAPGTVTTEHDSHHPVIPHARTSGDDTP
ncbi:hypothetical protein OG223_53120 [Streptomyces sp. NBC_01478]|uniref:hypothetical protein n=1 Tax=Streptomyces sp. NBC_01478 TaxID=2903882 RepID=UPI002E33DDCE|nr:hypothetical protein [Streptomyces sp. NBC_01478]